jgi:hypothetical protein
MLLNSSVLICLWRYKSADRQLAAKEALPLRPYSFASPPFGGFAFFNLYEVEWGLLDCHILSNYCHYMLYRNNAVIL